MIVLGKKYDVYASTIAKILSRHGVDTRDSRESVGYKEVNIPNSDSMLFFYFLGLILTDGWIYERKYSRTIGFGSKDHETVEYLRDHISPGRTIYDDKGFHRLLLPITEDQRLELAGWGVIKQKSLKLAPTDKLKSITDDQFFQLLVGLIEGDGTCFVSGKGFRTIYLYGTKPICEYALRRAGSGHLIKSKTIWRATWTSKAADKLYDRLMQCEHRSMKRKWD